MRRHQHKPALALLLILFCAATAAAQSKVHFINVGQADSILVELPKAALLIDAGGEDTVDGRDADHLVGYLERFFRRRADLNRTFHSVIVSHPHLDHTRLLMDVLNPFKVQNLFDGGENIGSGIGPLRSARALVRRRGANYQAVSDSRVGADGFTNAALDALRAADADVDVRILSGSRDCANGNNDSLVVLVKYGAAKFLFTGDAEAEDDNKCTAALTHLMRKYRGSGLLDVDVLKVSHHGARNGMSDEWMRATSPEISVISAGVPSVAAPSEFHAWFFGHPREVAVAQVERGTSGSRTTVSVTTMDGVRRPRRQRQMSKAVYCTCWDGDVVINAERNGAVSPEPCPR
jgi:beta-lactamase superfamily II metal-dependent hydrolase